MWALRNLKRLGASPDDLVDVWLKQGRSLLEYASPLWTHSITDKEVSSIEACQKVALGIIFGKKYVSYSNILQQTGLLTLNDRRNILFERFSFKTFKNAKYEKWFERNLPKEYHTRTERPFLKPIPTTSAAYERSALPMMISVINNKLKQNHTKT